MKVRIGTATAEGRNRESDEIRPSCFEGWRIEAKLFGPGGPRVVNQDVRPIDQAQQFIGSRFRTQFELHAAFIGIERKKEPASLGVGNSGRKGPAAAHPAIFARLDFHHVRTVIRQEPGRKGARYAVAQFQDAHLS